MHEQTFMKVVCVDPIANSNGCVSVCLFEDGELTEHQVLDAAKDEFSQIKADIFVCYDIFKIFSSINEFLPLKDIKSLCGLSGVRRENFTSLAKEALSDSKTFKYFSLLEKVNAHIRSYEIAKINIFNYSIFEMVPRELILDLYKEKSKIILEIYSSISKDEELTNFYKKFYPTLKTLFKISKEPILVDLESIRQDSDRFAESIRKNCIDNEIFLKFNPTGAKTGRITFAKGSVSVYTLPKDLRRAFVAPINYKIIQVDFRSFQPRLAIFCTDNVEFKNKFMDVEDIYSVFPGNREENKLSFISWMFSKRKNEVFDTEAAPILKLREDLCDTAKREGRLINKFGRPLYYKNEEKNVLFQNYITSNEVDAILSLAVWLNFALSRRKSRIAFPFHDSLVLYMHNDEQSLINPIKDYMEQYLKSIFGSSFPVSVKQGKNFRDIEEIQ